MTTKPDNQPSASKRRPFRDVVLASGLVTAADLESAEALARDRLAAAEATTGGGGAESTAAGGGRRFDEATAAVLVEQGKLTPFQAREIQMGRTRFRLGQYTVIDEVGRGGMGQVFKAEHALMGRHVAVKVLPRAKATPESEAAFRREMRILGRLDHENLVRAFDAGYDAQVYYLVTELVPGIDLRRQVREYGALDETAAASVFSQVARGLAFAHVQSLVHRDVKPGNILVMDDGRVKVLDLGLAGSTLEEEAIRLGRVVGTMDYIAPEQIRTPDDVGPPADIYSLGCSMYFALTGAVPFPGGSRKDKMRRHLTETPVPVHRLAPHLPQPLCHVVEAMMAKSVADRIGSADEVIQRLARWTPDRPTPLPRQPRGDAPAMRPAGDLQAVGDMFEDGSAGVASGTAWPILDDTGRPDESRPGRRPAGAGGAAGSATGFGAVARELLGVVESLPVVATAVRMLVPAALAGLGCAIAVAVARGIAPPGFRRLVGGVSVVACGGVAFLLVLAAQAAAGVGRRHRR